jgi:hypothetical protein
MNTQKNATISLIVKIILILLTVSIFYTLVIFLISSESLKPWQSPEINPYASFSISPHLDILTNTTRNYESTNQFRNNPEGIHGNKTVIGPFKDGNYTITLVDQDDEILEIISGYGNTGQYLLKPERISKTNFDERSLGIPDTTAGIALYRITLQKPENESDQRLKNIEIYDTWVEREWNMGISRNVIHTEGRFFGIYGQEIIQVIDKSYSVSSPLFEKCQNCRTETGHGDAAGWISTDTTWALRNFPLHAEYSTSSWIAVDIYYHTQFGISSDKWVSASASACRTSATGGRASMLY